MFPGAVEGETLLDPVVARLDRVEGAGQFRRIQLGQEREPTEVHAQHGHPGGRGNRQRAQDRPISTGRDHQVRLVRERVGRRALDGRQQPLPHFWQRQQPDMVLARPRHDRVEHLVAIAPWVRDDADRLHADVTPSRCHDALDSLRRFNPTASSSI